MSGGVPMRGDDDRQAEMLLALTPVQLVLSDHPIRRVCATCCAMPRSERKSPNGRTDSPVLLGPGALVRGHQGPPETFSQQPMIFRKRLLIDLLLGRRPGDVPPLSAACD